MRRGGGEPHPRTPGWEPWEAGGGTLAEGREEATRRPGRCRRTQAHHRQGPARGHRQGHRPGHQPPLPGSAVGTRHLPQGRPLAAKGEEVPTCRARSRTGSSTRRGGHAPAQQGEAQPREGPARVPLRWAAPCGGRSHTKERETGAGCEDSRAWASQRSVPRS